MARVSYGVEVLEEGRNYHSFEITCPHCHERAIAVLDDKQMAIRDIMRGHMETNGQPNVVYCNSCACLFRVDPKIETRADHLGEMLREVKFPKGVYVGEFGHIVKLKGRRATKAKKILREKVQEARKKRFKKVKNHS